MDDLFVRWDDPKYGNGRFLGTIDPFYRAVNPDLPGAFASSSLSALAETCGLTSQTDITFQVLFQQINDTAPNYVQVYINNANEMTGTDTAHAFTAYTMYPSPNQTQPYDYKHGVWYQYTTKLPMGPHTYYFQAYDGIHEARYPVRPDQLNYGGAGSYYNDWWVPTSSLETDRGTASYVDNDYCPGPFINHPCVLSQNTVTPGTGKQGNQFEYQGNVCRS